MTIDLIQASIVKRETQTRHAIRKLRITHPVVMGTSPFASLLTPAPVLSLCEPHQPSIFERISTLNSSASAEEEEEDQDQNGVADSHILAYQQQPDQPFCMGE